jgi:hypothetical protein
VSVGGESAQGSVAERLKSQFAPAYLTLTSIIQGVALSTLVMRVESTYAHFDAVDWLLAVTTFLVIVDIWHEYLMMVLAYVWWPTLLDSLVPFAFLAAEVFMAHFVFGDLRHWLLAFAAANAVGIAAWQLQVIQTRGFERENRALRRALSVQNAWRGIAVLVITTLSLLAFALYDAAGLDNARLAVAIGALIATCIFLASSVPYLSTMLGYARSEQSLGA